MLAKSVAAPGFVQALAGDQFASLINDPVTVLAVAVAVIAAIAFIVSDIVSG